MYLYFFMYLRRQPLRVQSQSGAWSTTSSVKSTVNWRRGYPEADSTLGYVGTMSKALT